MLFMPLIVAVIAGQAINAGRRDFDFRQLLASHMVRQFLPDAVHDFPQIPVFAGWLV